MYTNFYNPYMNYGYANNFMNASKLGGLGKTGLFSSLFKNFSLSKFLSGTGKTLNVINQAIPIYYQVKPMINNAKTMFKVISAVRNSDNNTNNQSNITTKTKYNYVGDGNPTFFV